MLSNWRIVAATFTMAVFAWGIGFYGLAVYLVALSGAHGWPIAAVSTPITAYYMIGAAITVYSGDLYRRFAAPAVIAVGAVAMAASLLALGAVTRPWQLYPAMALMSVGWALLSSAAINAIIAPWFASRRGMAISLALTGASVAGVVTAPLMTWLNIAVGFATTNAIVAAATVVVLVPMSLAWLRHRPEATTVPGATGADAGLPGRAALLRSPHFWTVSAPFCLGLFAQVGFITHQLAILLPRLGTAEAALCVSLLGLGAIAGRLGPGLVIDRVDPRTSAAVNFLVQCAGLALVWLGGTDVTLYVGSLLVGLAVGNMITFPSLIVQREFPPAAFARVVSLIVAINQVVFSFGPGFLGWVKSWTGSYDAGLAACIAIELACAVIVSLRVTPGASAHRPQSPQ